MARENSINRLNIGEYIKLGKWLSNKAESIKSMKLTKFQVADLAHKELKFHVLITHRHIDRALEEMPELGLEFGTPKNNPFNRTVARLDKLREAVVQLYAKCGEDTPQEIGIDW